MTGGEVGKVQVTGRTNLFKLVGLRVVVDALTVAAPRIAPLLESGVIQTARFRELAIKQVSLCACWIDSVLESFSQLSALLRFDVFTNRSFGDVADRPRVVRTTPQTWKHTPKIIKFFAHHARRITFELSDDVRDGQRRVTFKKQVNVVGLNEQRVNLSFKFRSLFREQFCEAICDVINQYRLAILRTKDDCVFERINRPGIL